MKGINVGDFVTTVDNRTGFVSDICNCEECEKRGFYELHIKYTDGSEDWITKHRADHLSDFYEKIGTFEFKKTPTLLIDTVKMMSSKDYKERFKAEYYQLVIRYEKLKKMVNDWNAGILKFTPTCPKYVYKSQLKVMNDYIQILKFRADLENVEL
mgnify:CR=1 FL=1